jgi:hypothetical protein
MASISMSWAAAEDLFSEVDFDFLYAVQLRSLGTPGAGDYPYALLVHTGRILISINLANWIGLEDGPNARGLPVLSDAAPSWFDFHTDDILE